MNEWLKRYSFACNYTLTGKASTDLRELSVYTFWTMAEKLKDVVTEFGKNLKR